MSQPREPVEATGAPEVGDRELDAQFDDFLDSAQATDAHHRHARTGTVWGIVAIPVAFVGITLLAGWALPPLYLFVALVTSTQR